VDLRHLLKNHPTFQVASDQKRELFAQTMQIVAIPSGGTIFEQGRPI
jgi:CRP-like cAMP-binding protein